jgi:hypothetical protein
MKYVLAPNNVFQRFVLPGEVVQFSDRCKTTAKRLTAEEAAEYGVAVLKMTAAPAHDPVTQQRSEIDPLLVDGVWTQQWAVTALAAEVIAANQIAAAAALQEAIVAATQARLDDFAQTRNYDSILSACTYTGSEKPKFNAEGQYAKDARDDTWAALYAILAEVQAGTRPMPTGFEDVEPDLPILAWPA